MSIIDKSLFIKALKDSAAGRTDLKKIIKSHRINTNMDFVILMPTDDKICNMKTLLYLNMLTRQFEIDKNELEKRHIPVLRENEKFVILAVDPMIKEIAPKIFNRVTEVVIIDQQMVENIMKRYTFLKIERGWLIIASLDEPNGRQCRQLINSKQVTLDDLIAVGILGVRYENYKKWIRSQKNLKINIHDEKFIPYIEALRG